MQPASNILFAKKNGVCQAAVFSENHLYEFAEYKDSLVGCIYKARVLRKLETAAAVFADIGNGQQVFVNYEDLISSDVPSNGKYLLVQITRNGDGHKAPAASGKIKISGEYLVYMPYADRSGISKKIIDFDEKVRLRDIVKSLAPDHYIVRSTARDIESSVIGQEALLLKKRWLELQKRFAMESRARLLFREFDFSLKYFREMRGKYDFNNLFTNDITVKAQLYDVALKAGVSVKYIDSDLFSLFGLESALINLKSRVFKLPEGIELIFDVCETLTAIDVNSSGYEVEGSGASSLAINMTAAQAIVNQIRLRHLGGIILVDFLKMPENEQNIVTEIVRSGLANDSQSSDVFGFTKAGLLEIIRKNSPYMLKNQFES